MTINERIWSTFLHSCVRYESGNRLTNTSLRERFGLPANKTTVVSQTISAATAAGLVKLDRALAVRVGSPNTCPSSPNPSASYDPNKRLGLKESPLSSKSELDRIPRRAHG